MNFSNLSTMVAGVREQAVEILKAWLPRGRRLAWCWVCFVSIRAASTLLCASDYRLDSFTLSPGGGTSVGGAYELTGTVGQVDAEAGLSGGGFRLEGGFWPTTVEVLVEDGPTLEISIVEQSIRIAWLPAKAGYVIQVASSPDAATWLELPGGSVNPLVLPVTDAPRFFRLFRR